MADDRSSDTKQKKWWCNFCGFRTDDEKAYLAHSCKDELAKKKDDPKAE